MHDETSPQSRSGTPSRRAREVTGADTEAGPLSGDSSQTGDADARVIHVRLNGPDDRIGEVLAGLEELPGVENIVQLVMDAPVQRDDSSSAESTDDNPSSFQEVELELVDAQACDDARRIIEGRAARAGVVLEWLDRF